MSDKQTKAGEKNYTASGVVQGGQGDAIPMKIIWIRVIPDPQKRVFFRYQQTSNGTEGYAYFELTAANASWVKVMADSMANPFDNTKDIYFDEVTNPTTIKYVYSEASQVNAVSAIATPSSTTALATSPTAPASSDYNTHRIVANIRKV